MDGRGRLLERRLLFLSAAFAVLAAVNAVFFFSAQGIREHARMWFGALGLKMDFVLLGGPLVLSGCCLLGWAVAAILVQSRRHRPRR